MELKVWVEGIQRIVCGVTESTTCQDIVYALAHATGKTGRFTLIERWRNNERLLAPQEHPLKVVNKWGEYSSEVQLILQRSGGWQGSGGSGSPPASSPIVAEDAARAMLRNNISNNKQQQQQPQPVLQLSNSTKHQQQLQLLNSSRQQQGDNSREETVVYNSQYRDLVRLINYQREKLSAQQVELTKYDAEIVFWESKTREHQHQIEFMTQEAARFEATANSNELKLKALSGIEEERDLVQQQERTLKSELTLLRSKLANCETELLQCKNKIRLLSEELEVEERAKEEMALLVEVDRLQREIEQARHSAEMTTRSADALRSQVISLETAITEKKRQVERLVTEMKEANLQSLAVAPPEEIRQLLEGPHKAGSTRRMIGSPRQLENAVPTSKNPHGVWV
ncbi:hypothetical protein AAG570_011061 [Ranatra chinensis]|uniref:Ras-associating domain-containing protein n=1 Tax=Ranatra chinensis TaxID=642074 RepID=A0ABD0Z7U1_9HEMI